MPIPDYHLYEGAVLSLIAARGEFTGLTRFTELQGHAFAINHDIGIYVKHSTKSDSPWLFNFLPDHQGAIRKLFDKYRGEKTFVALVCEKVGVCLLKYGEYAGALDENFRKQATITVQRPRGGGFRVHGAAGKVAKVVPLNAFPEDIFK
jgi:hypothetical protein